MSKTATAVKGKNTKKPSTFPGTRKGTSVASKSGIAEKRQPRRGGAAQTQKQLSRSKVQAGIPAQAVESPADKQSTCEIISPPSLSEANALSSSSKNLAMDEVSQKPLSTENASLPKDKQSSRDHNRQSGKARQDAKETRQRAKASLGERYHRAAAEVGRLRKEFISALNQKAEMLGVERVGEAVPMRTAELESLNTEISEVRRRLQQLIKQKRQLRGSSPELNALNRRINDIRRQRNDARAEKKAAFLEATTKGDFELGET